MRANANTHRQYNTRYIPKNDFVWRVARVSTNLPLIILIRWANERTKDALTGFCLDVDGLCEFIECAFYSDSLSFHTKCDDGTWQWFGAQNLKNMKDWFTLGINNTNNNNMKIQKGKFGWFDARVFVAFCWRLGCASSTLPFRFGFSSSSRCFCWWCLLLLHKF